MENTLGTIVMILAVAMTVTALPSQIAKNYKKKESGLSFLMTILPFLVYFFRAIYSAVIQKWFIFIPDVLGFILSIILIAQYFHYKDK